MSDLTAPLLDPAFYAGDPFPHYSRLRAEAPMAWNDEPGFWAVSRHADVLAVSSDPATFCSGRGILVFEIGVAYESPPTMMHTDPPAHTRYRKLIQPAFKPSLIGGLEPAVRRRARLLLDEIVPGQATDIVRSVAAPLPLQVISDLLGIPEEEWERFYDWSEAAIPGATDWPEERLAALRDDMSTYLLDAAKRRRDEPGSDIISTLATASVEGDRLSDAELVMFLVQLLVAGNETTRNLISGGLYALAEAPEQWVRLRADPSPARLSTAVDELLRWTTPVIAFMRTATRATEVGGQAVRAGDPLLLLYASANRDEAVFGPTAAALDVTRDPNPQLAFGFGAHFCIGAALARMEARVLLEEMLTRYATVAPAGPVTRTESSVIAGVRAAPLEFAPA